MYADTVDGSLIIVSVPAEDRFGWTPLGALERKQVCQIVDITAGAITTVNTVKTSQSRALVVLLRSVHSLNVII